MEVPTEKSTLLGATDKRERKISRNYGSGVMCTYHYVNVSNPFLCFLFKREKDCFNAIFRSELYTCSKLLSSLIFQKSFGFENKAFDFDHQV